MDRSMPILRSGGVVSFPVIRQLTRKYFVLTPSTGCRSDLTRKRWVVAKLLKYYRHDGNAPRSARGGRRPIARRNSKPLSLVTLFDRAALPHERGQITAHTNGARLVCLATGTWTSRRLCHWVYQCSESRLLRSHPCPHSRSRCPSRHYIRHSKQARWSVYPLRIY